MISSLPQKHCQRHNEHRLLSPKLELSLQLKKVQFQHFSFPPLFGNNISHVVPYRRRTGFSIKKNAKIWVIPLNFVDFSEKTQRFHPTFSSNFVTFYTTEFSPKFSANLVTFSSQKFPPFLQFTKILAKIGENSIENQFRLYPQKFLNCSAV